MSDVTSWASDELDRIGISGEEKAIYLETLTRFLDYFDSGGAMSIAAPILRRLLSTIPLSPLTGADDEWVDVSHDMFQNKRCFTVFKTLIDRPHRGLKAGDAYDLSVEPLKPITFPYNVDDREIQPPVYEVSTPNDGSEPTEQGSSG